MRLKSEVWVKAYLRRCVVNGAMAVIARHGDDDAGAIFIRAQTLTGDARVFAPAPAGRDDGDAGRLFVAALAGRTISANEAETYLQREVRFDSDIWIVDVEDRDGRDFLGEDLVSADAL